MINPQVVKYIKEQLAIGVDSNIIKQNLKQSGGWTDQVIDENFSTAQLENPIIAMTPEVKLNENKIRRRIFLVNILIFILYTGGSIIFNYPSIIFSGYLIHALALVLFSIIMAVVGIVTKKKRFAGDYFLIAIFICIIGFGSCVLSFN